MPSGFVEACYTTAVQNFNFKVAVVLKSAYLKESLKDFFLGKVFGIQG